MNVRGVEGGYYKPIMRSEERRVGKDVVGVDLGGRRIIKKTIYWLIVASTHSTDNHGYSLFHSKAVIGKESAPKAICGIRVRHLRLWLLCLPIFNRNNANNHLLAYSSLPQLHGQSWVQFIPQ